MDMQPITPADLDAVLALNQQWVPHVGSLDREGLAHLVGQAECAVWSPHDDGSVAGFVIALGPGADYASPNYQWFSARHERFAYVDRIAVDPARHGSGLGRRLYDLVVGRARAVGSPVLCCEVNLQPPNPGSLAFHAAIGFVEVGRQWTYHDTVEVQLLERPA